MLSRMQYLHDRKYGKDKWESLSPNEKQAAMAEMKETRAKMLSVPASDPMDENFRRLVYVRYADDFLIGVIGSQQDAFDIKNKVGAFLKENLHLEMSEEKTLITHAKRIRLTSWAMKSSYAMTRHPGKAHGAKHSGL